MSRTIPIRLVLVGAGLITVVAAASAAGDKKPTSAQAPSASASQSANVAVPPSNPASKLPIIGLRPKKPPIVPPDKLKSGAAEKAQAQ